jgi:hypothetical protein
MKKCMVAAQFFIERMIAIFFLCRTINPLADGALVILRNHFGI